MNLLAKALVVDTVATVIGNALWKGYKGYCRWCWKKFSKKDK
jgi:hypothetical protein